MLPLPLGEVRDEIACPAWAAASSASFGTAEPFPGLLLALGMLGGGQLADGLVEFRIAFSCGLGDPVPFHALDLVVRRGGWPQQPPAREAVLRDRTVLPGRLAQQCDRRVLVSWCPRAVIERDRIFDLGIDIVG